MKKIPSFHGSAIGLLLIFFLSVSRASVTQASLPVSFYQWQADLRESPCFSYSEFDDINNSKKTDALTYGIDAADNITHDANTISFSSPSGTYFAAPVSVSLSASLSGTRLYYTTDGSAPTETSPLYSEPIMITKSGTTLRVLALKDNAENVTASATYVIQPEAPIFDKGTQYFARKIDVSLSLPKSAPSSTSKIFYAINETADATKTLYNGTPVAITGTSYLQNIFLHAVVVDEYGNVGKEENQLYIYSPYTYYKVTSLDKIMDDGQYLLVCEDESLAMTSQASGDHHMVASKVNIANNRIYTKEDIAVTLVKQSDGSYRLKLPTGGYLASTEEDKTNLEILKSPSSDTKEQVSWNITLDSNSNVVIKNPYTVRVIMKATDSSNSDFRAYKKGYNNGKAIQLYRKVYYSFPLTLRAQGDDSNYYATFSSTEDIVFNNKVTVSTVSVDNGSLQIRPLETGNYTIYGITMLKINNGYYVPANTGVLLSSPTVSPYCYIPIYKQNVTIDQSNQLVPVSTDGTFTGQDGYKYYKLAYDNSTTRTGLGFYWGASYGGPFNVVAGLAYLAVPNSAVANVKSGFQFSQPTGIDAVKTPEADGKIYTLTGQQIDKIKGRGVYIINGKKVVVRH